MGNTPSQEAPRRPHKLTKPHLDLQVPVAGFPDPALDSPSCHGRSSNSYLVGSVPISPTTSSPTDSMAFTMGGSTIPGDEIDNSMTPINHLQSSRDSRRWSNVSRTWSFRSEYSPRRHSMIAANSRPHSLIIDGSLPLTRSDSLHATTGRGSASYDVRNYEIQRLVSLDQEILSKSAMATLDGHSPAGDVTEITWKSSHPTQSASIPVDIANSDRTNSDLSMYLPVRRRSIIQTPGVATRAQRSDTSSSSKTSSFQSTISTTPEETRHNSIESGKEDKLTIPAVNHGSYHPERVVTPCEAEYKQLGGIKFGSLRIVNGSPRPSPMSENNVGANNPQSSDQAYFDCETPCSPMETLVSSDADSMDPVQKQLFKTSISLATALNTTDETDHTKLSPFSENEDGQACPSTEISHVRDDSNAKPTPERVVLGLENETLKSLTRSDSGFVSSPSSEGSRKVASKTDSGYSSNVSLRSLRSLKSAVTDRSRKSPERQKNKPSEKLHPEKPTLSTVPANALTQNTLARSYPPPKQMEAMVEPKLTASEEVTQVKNSTYRSLTSLTRGKILRIPSLRSSKSIEFQPRRLESQSNSGPPGPPLSQVNTVSGSGSSRPRPPRLTLDTANVGHDARAQRSIGSQRRGPPKVRDNRMKERNISSRPIRVSNAGTGSNPRSANLHNRPWLRDEKSEDTLRTILSVGSTDVLGRQSSGNVHEVAEEAQPATQTQRRKSLRRSLTQVATALFSLDKSSVIKVFDDSDTKNSSDAKSSNYKTESVTNHNVQRGEVTSAIKNTPMRAKINRVESAPQFPTKRTMSRTPSSNTIGRNPLHVDLSNTSRNTRKPKTPPPVSMRTRSVRVPQSQKLESRRSAPSAEVAPVRRRSLPQDFRREPAHSYLPTQNPTAVYGMSLNGAMSLTPQQMAGLQGYQMMPMNMVPVPYYPTRPTTSTGHRRTRSMPIQNVPSQPTRTRSMHTSSQHNYYPVQVQRLGSSHQAPQQLVQSIDPMLYQHFNPQVTPNLLQNQAHHRRAISQGSLYNTQTPPYRVLHSYASPAYRGVPTWG